jgi:hypothetical protein
MALRLGDDVDDYCVKCKRVTNHAIVSLVSAEPARVRCRSCYAEQTFRKCEVPPSKKDLRKAALFQEVLGSIPQAAAPAPDPPADPPPADPPSSEKPRRKKA